MTVSRVVNGETNVLSETRERVERAIAALRYVPNPAARSLASRRHRRIGLLYSNPSGAYLSEFLLGALAGAAERDAQLIVEQVDGDEDADQLVGRLVVHRVDAVLLPPPLSEDKRLLAALLAAALPIAQIAVSEPEPGAFAVAIDDEAAAKAITEHLLALGHHRIGFIGGSPDQSSSELRARGYQAALDDARVPLDPLLVAVGDFSYRSGLTAAEQLLSMADRPTAIFASNDEMAAAVVATARRHRLEVPADLSVCGFDDTAIATTIWPELTTVRQPIHEMAKSAALRLIDASEREDVAADRGGARLNFELVVRGSTAQRI